MRRLGAFVLVLALLSALGAVALRSPVIAERVALLTGKTVYPKIVPAPDVTGTRAATREFSFEGRRYRVEATADAAVYQGAISIPRSASRLGGFPDDSWVPGYYRAFVNEPHQRPLYDSLLASLRSIRSKDRLDDDRYLELVTGLVQSLEYRIDASNSAPKFPIQTWVEGAGDCDDKALLLAGLLSAEDYDVAVLFFEPEKHVALGVRVDGPGYGGTGYAFVETTKRTLVGFPPERLASGVSLTSKPTLITIGSGRKRFTSIGQSQAIRDGVEEARKRRAALEDDVTESRERISEAEGRLAEMRTEIERLAAARDVPAYDARAAEYRSAYAEYRELIRRDGELVGAFNRTIEVERRVAEHQDDRPGLYSYVRGLTW